MEQDSFSNLCFVGNALSGFCCERLNYSKLLALVICLFLCAECVPCEKVSEVFYIRLTCITTPSLFFLCNVLISQQSTLAIFIPSFLIKAIKTGFPISISVFLLVTLYSNTRLNQVQVLCFFTCRDSGPNSLT